MRKYLLATLILALAPILANAQQWIRINQVGYLPADKKVAVFISTEPYCSETTFSLHDSVTGEQVFEAEAIRSSDPGKWGMKSAFRLDFSDFEKEGGYYLQFGGIPSPAFRISPEVYDGLSDYLLKYMRQQRCGDNPFTEKLCHQKDGYIVEHPTRNGEYIDVTGGWHDASDYLQYQTTSATATYHLLFTYMEAEDKSIFKDLYDAGGRKGANGIPDILDEARWGLDWLLKMNPDDKEMYAQIADDRDHLAFRAPQDDPVDYGWGPGNGRPVYYVTGEPQGLGKWINRSTGVASVAGKFSSTFALASELYSEIDPEFSKKLKVKAEQAYDYAEEKPGNTQTCCLRSPYFYEEDTYTDDVELAAATFYHYGKGQPHRSYDEVKKTGAPVKVAAAEKDAAEWLKAADYWGQLEPVSPWMQLGTGRHYQFYPFINLGHYYLAKCEEPLMASKYQGFMRQGLQYLADRAEGDPFLNGIPYIWCSNNLTSAAITHARLYHKTTGDETYLEMEAALRDWLLGCNPWGTSMIIGYPEGGEDVPEQPHSAFTVLENRPPKGGLLDGPVYRSVFLDRAGACLTKEDAYEVFNHGIAVYHDDSGDYASNEPTMDGTAGLTYYFAAKEGQGLQQKKSARRAQVVRDTEGAIIRINPDQKDIYLVFTADSLFNGVETILNTLKKNKIHGSFFLTGNCLRMPEHAALIRRMVKEGHYVGGHSDGHLLYAPWEDRSVCLVTPDSLRADLVRNAQELERFGVTREASRWFLPPYEYYNQACVHVIESMGYQVVNYTPGTATPADYTIPSMKSYRSSQELIDRLYAFEKSETLNGALLMIHPGVQEARTDRLFDRLGEIIRHLKRKGYRFCSLADVQ